MAHLGTGFWFMRGVPAKQGPCGTKPFNSFWVCCATPYLKTEWPWIHAALIVIPYLLC
jgi:hypothetical protein